MGAGEGAKQVKVLTTKFQPAQKETTDFCKLCFDLFTHAKQINIHKLPAVYKASQEGRLVLRELRGLEHQSPFKIPSLAEFLESRDYRAFYVLLLNPVPGSEDMPGATLNRTQFCSCGGGRNREV